MKDEVNKYIQNPGCPSCSVPLFRRILKEAIPQLEAYFPNSVIEEPSVAADNWTVINCHINELESKMRKLKGGRKQISMARFEDQVTVIINELDVSIA